MSTLDPNLCEDWILLDLFQI